MKIGKTTFDSGTHVMAIINLTPDSFYANSRTTVDDVLKRVEKAVKYGAEVIDVGGQSTRPSHTPISAQEEWQRLEKPIELIKKNFDIPLSVDTYYPYVAENALLSGADLINDVWGLQYENQAFTSLTDRQKDFADLNIGNAVLPSGKNGENVKQTLAENRENYQCRDAKAMANIIAKYNASVCIMHNQNHIPTNDNLWSDIFSFLDRSVELAKSAGIDGDKILIDGGIGFGKNKEQNWIVLEHYEKLGKYGYPLLLGTSRKSMFGGEVQDRLAPTLESTKLAVKKGILFVRVHDVKENIQTIRQCSLGEL